MRVLDDGKQTNLVNSLEQIQTKSVANQSIIVSFEQATQPTLFVAYTNLSVHHASCYDSLTDRTEDKNEFQNLTANHSKNQKLV